MFKKLIIINIVLMLVFQPISQAFSAPVFLLDQDHHTTFVDMSSMDCGQGDSQRCIEIDCCEFVGHAKCDINKPLGYLFSYHLSSASVSSYGGFSENRYLFVQPDTLLRPPRNV